jgi:hypothetical protein
MYWFDITLLNPFAGAGCPRPPSLEGPSGGNIRCSKGCSSLEFAALQYFPVPSHMLIFAQSGKADYQLGTLLLLCPVIACEDGSPFYMRGEEEVFCANSNIQFSFKGDSAFYL